MTIFADENGAVSRGAGLQKQVGQPSYGESTPNNSIAKETEKSNTEIDAGDTAFEYDAETESVNEQHQLLTWEASDYVTERNKAAKEMAELQQEVRYEPEMALYGGEDGLDFYRAMTKLWKSSIKSCGFIAYEFGMGQHDAVKAILEENGFTDVELRRDGGGIIRTAAAVKALSR